jgi:hypothetical protein
MQGSETARRVGAWLGRGGALVARGLGALCASRLGRPRPWRQTLLAAALLVPAVLWLHRGAFDSRRPVRADGHAAMSLEIAVNRLEFGTLSAMGRDQVTGDSIHKRVAEDPEILSQRVLDLPSRVEPSREGYAALLVPFVNNENSLMLLDEALLRLAPGLTVTGLALAHLAVKAACLAVFALLLLRAGFSPVLAGAALHLGLLIVSRLGADCPLSLHPLLAPAVLLYLAVLGLALTAGAHRRAWATAGVLAGAGLAAGFLANLRTSYAPVAGCLLLLYLLVGALDLRRCGAGGLKIAALSCLGLAAFVGGYRAFTAACIDPIQALAAQAEYTYTRHVIGHPLVLSLALAPPPHDELARREGITWDDGRGLDLAHRIDPAVEYLDDHYDEALLAYYAKLWLYYPGEMRDLYAAKLDKAGVDCLAFADELGVPSDWLSWPLGLLPTGRQWLLAFGALTLGALLVGRWLGAAASFTLAGLAATAALLLLEAAAVVPTFCLQYHSLLQYCALLAGLLPYQLGLDAVMLLGRTAVRLMRRGRRGGAHPTVLQVAPRRLAA